MVDSAEHERAEVSAGVGSPLAKSGSVAAPSSAAARIWHDLRPKLHQTWLNLRVWMPVLLNPSERQRQIRYWARESCEGHTWMIALPARCWYCGRTDGLRTREYRTEVRGFEYPLLILATAAGAALFLLLFSWVAALLALLLAAVGIAVKSWREDVRLVISTCDEHAADLRRPDMVLDQGELFVYSPTHQLAAAAIDELKAARRQAASTLGREGGGRTLNVAAASSGDPPPLPRSSDGPTGGPYRPRTAPMVPDLPPIKLAGDDDDPAPPASERPAS